MELADYNIICMHINDKNNVLADVISRLKTLNIYKEPLEDPKTPVFSNMEGCVTEIHVHCSYYYTPNLAKVGHNVLKSSVKTMPR